MKWIFIAALSLVLSGCDDIRNSPSQQVIDYSTCTAGGMRAYLNSYAEVRCAPPEASVKP